MIPIFQVDAFAERPFAGNPAAVVLDARGLSDQQMQAIAAEMNLAGTAFLTPALGGEGAQWHLRWFTPTREVAYSGHTTVGAHASSVHGAARPRARGRRSPCRRGLGGRRHHA